jgi:hypothetical protein
LKEAEKASSSHTNVIDGYEIELSKLKNQEYQFEGNRLCIHVRGTQV